MTSIAATAIIERLNRTFKSEHTRRVTTPLCRKEAQAQWSRYFRWYNEHRPHESLAGKTPNEVYSGVEPAKKAPRFEPRARWPSSAPCARPQAAPRPGPAPRRLDLHVRFLDDERTLPVVELKQAA